MRSPEPYAQHGQLNLTCEGEYGSCVVPKVEGHLPALVRAGKGGDTAATHLQKESPIVI